MFGDASLCHPQYVVVEWYFPLAALSTLFAEVLYVQHSEREC